MTIHKGGVPTALKSVTGAKEEEEDQSGVWPKLYHIRGLGGPLEVRAVEVECTSANLHSNDVFVLLENNRVFSFC